MPRPSATDRLGRILAMVPWIASQDVASVDDVCLRFGIDRDQLIADLDVVFVVGLYPYTPDNLIEVDIDEDHVSISYTNFFERPLRLTRDEGLALLAAGLTARAQPGHDPDGALERGLAKLAEVLDIDLDDDLGVVLPSETVATQSAVERAIENRQVLHIGYFSHARNELTERDIEPRRVFTADGAWYVDAYCRSSQDQRLFRLDRITELEATSGTFDPPSDDAADTRGAPADVDEARPFSAREDLPRVVIDLPAGADWVIEHHPTEAVVDLGDGRNRVTLAASAKPWLERLLLRLGPDAHVVEAPAAYDQVAADAARRLLAHHSAR